MMIFTVALFALAVVNAGFLVSDIKDGM